MSMSRLLVWGEEQSGVGCQKLKRKIIPLSAITIFFLNLKPYKFIDSGQKKLHRVFGAFHCWRLYAYVSTWESLVEETCGQAMQQS